MLFRSAPEHRDGKGLPAKTNLLDRGLGSQFNIAIIAALLSLVVALVTSMITSRIAAEGTLKELRRDQERQAIIRRAIEGDRRDDSRGGGRTTSNIYSARGDYFGLYFGSRDSLSVSAARM